MKSTPLLFLLALITISTSTSEPNNITIDCEQCGAVACLNITGGPFDKFIYTTTNATCTDAGDFPTTYNFYCGPACPNCVVTPIYPNTSFQPTTNITAVGNCTTSSLGTPIITDLDTYYNALEMSTNQTYDWCSCPAAPQGINTGAFIGILCGIVGGWIVLGGTIWFFCCRNDSLNSYQEQK